LKSSNQLPTAHADLLYKLNLQLDDKCLFACWKCRATKLLIEIAQLHKPDSDGWCNICPVQAPICETIKAMQKEFE